MMPSVAALACLRRRKYRHPLKIYFIFLDLISAQTRPTHQRVSLNINIAILRERNGSFRTDREYRGIPLLFDIILQVRGNGKNKKFLHLPEESMMPSRKSSTPTTAATSIVITTVEYKHLKQQNVIRSFTRRSTRGERRCTQSAILDDKRITASSVNNFECCTKSFAEEEH